MSRKREPFVTQYKTQSSGSATDTIEIALPEGKINTVITLLRAWNETSAITSVQVKYGNRLSEGEIGYAGNPQIGERLVYNDAPIYNQSGFRCIVVFTGCSAGDNLRVVVMGWKEVVHGQ